MDRRLNSQEKEKVRSARADFFQILKRKDPTPQNAHAVDKAATSTITQPFHTVPNKRFKISNMPPSRSSAPGSDIPLIIRFYDPDTPSHEARDSHDRTLEQILSWNDMQLERSHNYIQMLFPLPEGSPFNWEAPVITQEVLIAFRSRRELRNRLRRSFERMLDFYGFTVSIKPEENAEKEVEQVQKAGEGVELETPDNSLDVPSASSLQPQSELSNAYFVVRGPHWHQASRNWAVRFDHNHLRITRILRCLRVLGLQTECDAFYVALKNVFDDPTIYISERSMMYWKRAVTRPLHIAPDDDRCGWLKKWEEEQEEVGPKEAATKEGKEYVDQ
ncbi:opioid growth factor receptor conserved region-domain-containing protein [Pyrenochaeta sp. MPI-SDFR-AT-0127]|nr:opioid growth factor receptor conserved region-domain-containing protein [Pyrenochaeta sp. MPI-SDFR-AT-0127]